MHPAALGDLGSMFDALPHAVIKADAQWLIVFMNTAAGRLLCADPRQASGVSIWPVLSGLPADFVEKARSGNHPHISGDFEILGKWRRVEIADAGYGGHLVWISDAAVAREQLESERSRRQAAEAALETNQQFLQAVLDNVETGIVACDETGALKLFNNASRRFHGLPATPLPPGEWAARYSLFYPDGITPLAKEDIPLYRAFSGEIVKNAEMVIAPKDGLRRTVLASGRALTGSGGKLLGAVVAMHDITHRKVFGERIRQALRQFRALFNDAPIAYHEIDVNGIIRRVNRAECRLLERTRREMIGRPVWDFVAAGERRAVRNAVFSTLAGEPAPEGVEREYASASGKRLVFEVHENLIRDSAGMITGIRSAMLDTTDRKQREQQTRALSQERAARAQAEATSAEIRGILERIGDAYIAFDTEWRYTYVNRKAAELALKPASELLGKCVWDEFPNAKQTAFYSELQRSLREQLPLEFGNYYAPLGKYFENSVYPSPSGVSVFYRDTTERVKAQRELEERTRELAAKNAELEMFASVASHDLQEPLRMIGGYATLLSRRYSGALDEDATEFLSYMTQGVSRMQPSSAICWRSAGSTRPQVWR